MGAQGLPAVVPRWPVQWGQPLSAEWAHEGWHAVPAACIITDYSMSTSLWQVRIELHDLRIMRPTRCQLRYRRSYGLAKSVYWPTRLDAIIENDVHTESSNGAMAQR